jgi:SAM-dependent methyltransferase
MKARATTAALIEAASAPYWKTDFSGYFKARGKLRGDPVFAGILREGLLVGAERILDLGCGQGLLAAWLNAAQRRWDERPHLWPPEWPAPPRPTSFRGIELQARDVWRATMALGERAQFEVGDIANADFGDVDAIVILDVLHYLDEQAQLRVLDNACAALSPEGTLLLRVGDAGSGIRFTVGQCIDWTVVVARYRRTPKMFWRPVHEWQRLLTARGFRSEALPMSAGTPFANTLLIARPQKKARQPRTLTDLLITQ